MSGDDAISPEEAFALISHDLRLSILLELADAPNRSLPFAELRRRVDVRDSGKFNYHLSKLEDRFVAHDADRDVYRLLYPGHRVVDAISTGVFHERERVEDVPLDEACGACGGLALTFTYDTMTAARVECADCERILVGYPFDPGGLTDRDGKEIARAYDRRTRAMWERAHADVCPVCSGRVDATFAPDVPPKLAATHDQPVLVAFDCRQCSYFCNVPVGALLTWEPDVVAFLADRGVDVRERRLWELPFVVDPDAVDVEDDDPWRVAVTVAADGDEREAIVDQSLALTSFE